MARLNSGRRGRGGEAPQAKYLGRVLFFWRNECTAEKLKYDRIYLLQQRDPRGLLTWVVVTHDTTVTHGNTENVLVLETQLDRGEIEQGFVRLEEPGTGTYKEAMMAWVKGCRPEDDEVARLAEALRTLVQERYGVHYDHIGTLEEMDLQVASPHLVGKLWYSFDDDLFRVAWIFANEHGPGHRLLLEGELPRNSDPDKYSIMAFEMQATAKYDYGPQADVKSLILIYDPAKLARELPDAEMWDLAKKVGPAVKDVE